MCIVNARSTILHRVMCCIAYIKVCSDAQVRAPCTHIAMHLLDVVMYMHTCIAACTLYIVYIGVYHATKVDYLIKGFIT
jgi:hypothetical protein